MGKEKHLALLLAVTVFLFAIVNFILCFTPEIGFDALWYHLTLPKLWILNKQYYFPGGLLYYSVMPRLTELFFAPLIVFTGTIGPKAIQYLSGIFTCFLIWKIGLHFNFKKYYLWLCVSLFYCTWLVSWESSSAYIDLFRTSLEVSALIFFLKKRFRLGGLFLGLAVGTKWLSLISLGIYTAIFGVQILPVAILVSLPWFLISYFYTNNPIYPLFSGILENGFQSLSGAFSNMIFAPIHLTAPFDDFISPFVGFLFVVSVISLVYLKGDIKKVAAVGFLGAVSTLLLDPPSSRFLLPYLPAMIITSVFLIQRYLLNLGTIIGYFCLASAIFIFSLRIYAAKKYVPYLLGHQNTNEFLTSVSGRLPNTFIDADNYALNSLPASSKILIDKLHNLYYFPHPFTHTSWIDKDVEYDYLVTIDQDPHQISGELIHTNQLGIQYYKLQ